MNVNSIVHYQRGIPKKIEDNILNRRPLHVKGAGSIDLSSLLWLIDGETYDN